MSRRTVRLVVVPGLLLLGVWGMVYGLAQEHPARSDAATANANANDPVSRGEALFAERCSGCHGDAGRNASIGPDLAGNPVTLDAAREQIENGGGGMPAGLVTGEELEDVLAYLDTIRAGEPTRED
jgi:mono/diheme cytochrome c family protein